MEAENLRLKKMQVRNAVTLELHFGPLGWPPSKQLNFHPCWRDRTQHSHLPTRLGSKEQTSSDWVKSKHQGDNSISGADPFFSDDSRTAQPTPVQLLQVEWKTEAIPRGQAVPPSYPLRAGAEGLGFVSWEICISNKGHVLVSCSPGRGCESLELCKCSVCRGQGESL